MTQQHQEKHRSLFGRKSNATASGQHHKLNLSASRLGQIAIDSTARGFGFFLGTPHTSFSVCIMYQTLPGMSKGVSLSLPSAIGWLKVEGKE